ncbi:3511_t:CDS:2, partial [Dentiscutata heterogama]
STSEVWGFFEKSIWQKDKKTAKCTISNCVHKEFSCENGGSTKPLWHHLEKAYWVQYIMTEDYCKKKKNTQDECGTIELPLAIIKDPELIEIIQYLNPTAQLVKADAIKNIIMSLIIQK